MRCHFRSLQFLHLLTCLHCVRNYAGTKLYMANTEGARQVQLGTSGPGGIIARPWVLRLSR